MESTGTSRRTDMVVDTLRRFARRGARANISKLLARSLPADVAVWLADLTPAEGAYVFQILVSDNAEAAGGVLAELEPGQHTDFLEQLTPQQIARVLEKMSVDDAVAVVDTLPAQIKERVLEVVDLRDFADVQTHLTYREDSAGRIMDPEYFALPESTTVRDAIAAIQDARDVEMIFYLYVVDSDGHLVGVTSLRQLLLASPRQTLAEIMTRAVIKATTDTDQEEVAVLAGRYDLLAIPVTDEGNRLVGIVTVDDIIDVVREEATEDIFKMVGTSDDELLYQERSWKVASIRLPYLLVNLLGLVVTGLMLQHFQVSLREQLFLLTFVPVIMGMGGNIGSQTATIAVRGLSTGRLTIGWQQFRSFLRQQLKVGAVIGLVCSALVAGGAYALEQDLFYSAVVGPALFVAIIVASANGAMVPFVFQRLGLDPAIASGPLVSTSQDITGILIYFGLATLLLEFFVR